MGWNFPVKKPRWTSEEFKKYREQYVQKYGYTLTVPGFEDIIHIPVERPITAEEEILWKKKDYEAIGPERTEEIRYLKKRRKEKFLAMLASPSPDIARNVASFMTMIDDTQDTLTTLSVVGRVAAKVAPRILGKLLTGPVGWIMTAADCINLYGMMGKMPIGGKSPKKIQEGWTGLNPFSKKAKAHRATRMKRVMPSKGELIEIMQTTDNLFGVGLCLGPILGLVQDIVFAQALTAQMIPVKVKVPVPDLGHWERLGAKMLKSSVFFGYMGQELTDREHRDTHIAMNLATHTIWPTIQRWNPLDMVIEPANVFVQAPIPTNFLTLEIFEEEGLDPADFVGWPGLNRPWAKPEDIFNATQSKAMDNFTAYCYRNQFNWDGFIAGNNACEFAENMIGLLEGEDQVRTDYIKAEKVCWRLNYGEWKPIPEVTDEQTARFAFEGRALEWQDYDPPLAQILREIPERTGYKFTQEIPTEAIGPVRETYPTWIKVVLQATGIWWMG